MKLFKFVSLLLTIVLAWAVSFRILHILWMPQTGEQWIMTAGFSVILPMVGFICAVAIGMIVTSIWDECD